MNVSDQRKRTPRNAPQAPLPRTANPYNKQVATLANPVTDAIAAKVHSGQRITPDDARHLWQHATDAELRAPRPQVRARFHPADRATYMVMRIINYTNVCVAQCDYCAFYMLPSQDGGYVLSREAVFAKIDELLALGGDLAAFNGGFNPHLPLDYYCDLFSAIRDRYGDHSSSTPSPSPSSSTSPTTPSSPTPRPPRASKPQASAGSPAEAARS